MLFVNPFKKAFSFLTFLSFCLDILGHLGKWLDKKVKVNFKMYDVMNWETNNNSKHSISQVYLKYLKK